VKLPGRATRTPNRHCPATTRRQPIVGRKNDYGCRTKQGLRVAEVLYTLIGTCRILGVRPDEYLEHAALRAIRNTNQRELLPHELAYD